MRPTCRPCCHYYTWPPDTGSGTDVHTVQVARLTLPWKQGPPLDLCIQKDPPVAPYRWYSPREDKTVKHSSLYLYCKGHYRPGATQSNDTEKWNIQRQIKRTSNIQIERDARLFLKWSAVKLDSTSSVDHRLYTKDDDIEIILLKN